MSKTAINLKIARRSDQFTGRTKVASRRRRIDFAPQSIYRSHRERVRNLLAGTFAASSRRGFGGGARAYQIARSLRLRSGASAYLSKTFGAGNQKKWTFSTWLKRGSLGVNQYVFASYSSGTDAASFYINFSASDELHIGTQATDLRLSNEKFRDPHAWYHLLVAMDAANGLLVAEVNDVAVTWATSTGPSNTNYGLNASGIEHDLGRRPISAYGYADLLLAETYFIDGEYLDASYFVETNAGRLDPKSYTGTYGTTGFYLPYSDNSGATSTTIGKDFSGNGNNWTPSGISVTAGTTNDSLVDTPTNYGTDTGVGGEVRGNYATLSPLDMGAGGSPVCSQGNLRFSNSHASVNCAVRASAFRTTGKHIFFGTYTNTSSDYGAIGIIGTAHNLRGITGSSYVGQISDSYGYAHNGQKVNNNSFASYGSSFTTAAVVVCAYDLDVGAIWFGIVSGGAITWQNSATAAEIASGNTAHAAYTWTPDGMPRAPAVNGYNGVIWDLNFGQRPWEGTANFPSGFKALCTQNLTDTTVALPSTFTGNASADGPVVWANSVITAVTINGNVATRGTHFDAIAGGIKLRSSSSSYNASGSNTVTAYTAGVAFKYARAQIN